MRSHRTLPERFWRHVDTSGDCWLWTASRNVGYGQFNLGIGELGVTYKQPMHAHRVAFMLTYGQILPGLHVCHRCDNPICVRPEHLFVGTNGENALDRTAKGRTAQGETHYSARLTTAQVDAIRLRGSSETNSALAREYGVRQSTISRIVRGERRKQG